jgi:hypothetical protein
MSITTSRPAVDKRIGIAMVSSMPGMKIVFIMPDEDRSSVAARTQLSTMISAQNIIQKFEPGIIIHVINKHTIGKD